MAAVTTQAASFVPIRLQFVSFGYKYENTPRDTVQNFDLRKRVHHPQGVRLKNTNGLMQEYARLQFEDPEAVNQFNDIKATIEHLVAGHLHGTGRNEEDSDDDEEGDEDEEDDDGDDTPTIKIGIGCHSGKHRSVAFAERLAKEDWGVPAVVLHQDISSHRGKRSTNKARKTRQSGRDSKCDDTRW
ncbi:hypothetical protein Pelo_12025 [Pelomyxa schiedti]|nr:hypothetical protein Pelo_12025 [Pelomyxa schiedti]